MDGFNRRVGRRVAGSLNKIFVYQDQLRIVAEMDSAGKFISRFVYSVKPNVPSYLRKGTTNFKIISNHLGSPRLVVNASTGTVEQRLTYDVQGKITLDTNPGYQPFGFAGGLWDVTSGLVRFGARDYDPQTGRWTAKDPILFNGMDVNLYGYSFSDPVNFVDSNGKIPAIVAPIAGGIIAGTINLGATLVRGGSITDAGRSFGVGFVGGAVGGFGVISGIGSALSVGFGVGASLLTAVPESGPRTGEIYKGFEACLKPKN